MTFEVQDEEGKPHTVPAVRVEMNPETKEVFVYLPKQILKEASGKMVPMKMEDLGPLLRFTVAEPIEPSRIISANGGKQVCQSVLSHLQE